MRKQILSVLLSFIIVISMTVPVFADSAITSHAVFDAKQGGIVVSGEVNTARFGQYVSLDMVNPDGKTVYADTILLPKADTDVKHYEFSPILLYIGNKTGMYTIKVTVEDVGIAQDCSYYFIGADTIHAALKEICSSINAEDTQGIYDNLLLYTDVFGIDGDTMKNLKSDEAKQAMISNFLGKSYTVPDGYILADDIAVIENSLLKLRSDFDTALSIGMFNDISTKDELKFWLTSYGTSFSKNDTTTDIDEEALYRYVLRASEESVYASRISGRGTAFSISDVAESLYKEALLTILETKHYTESKYVFEYFPSLFDLDVADYNKLSDKQKGNVYSDMTGRYESCIIAGNKFNSLVDKLLSNGKSGGSGGSGRNEGYSVLPPVTSLPEASVMSFPDMTGFEWADTAVDALKEKGIVSGDDNGNFNPGDSVTRAEFAKMMVILTGTELTYGDSGFADVDANDWFYAYVNAASVSGLIKGDGIGKFNPNEKITREDMAVIVYRAYEINESLGHALSFSDANLISDYAKEAVAFLSFKGVINGVGDNTFAPKKTASRAEAAQMLYNMLR